MKLATNQVTISSIRFATPPYSRVPTVIMISIAADASSRTWLGLCCSSDSFIHEVPISLDVLSSDRAPHTLNQAAETVGQSDDVSAKTRASRWANDRRSLPNPPQFDRPAVGPVAPVVRVVPSCTKDWILVVRSTSCLVSQSSISCDTQTVQLSYWEQ